MSDQRPAAGASDSRPSWSLEKIEALEARLSEPTTIGTIDLSGLEWLEQPRRLAADEQLPKVPARRAFGWALYDWGSQSYATLVQTFVIAVWLVDGFVPTGVDEAGRVAAENANTGLLAAGNVIAGVVVALLAPIVGARADRAGRRKRWLGIHTTVVILATAAIFFVRPDQDALQANVLLGVALVSIGNVFFEFAAVNYNATLSQVSNINNAGRVSGFGWGLGYIGGIVVLVLCLFGFVLPVMDGGAGWFGVTGDDGMAYRVVALCAAAWYAVFAIPLFLSIDEVQGSRANRRLTRADKTEAAGGAVRAAGYGVVSFFANYGKLFKDLRRLSKVSPDAVRFLWASAVFRDGLNAVFLYGAVIGATVFGLNTTEIILFGIGANVVAGITTIIAGYLDDLFGSRTAIVASLVGVIVTGSVLAVFHNGGKPAFFALALVLCAFIGPPQSASRSFLSRAVPSRNHGEVYGLYATTGRAVSFIGSSCFLLAGTIGVSLLGPSGNWVSILGLVFALLLGLVLFLVATGRRTPRASTVDPHVTVH